LSSYVSLFTALAWIAFVTCILVVFRKPLARIADVLETRVRGGASVKLGTFEVGQLITKTADVSNQNTEIYGNPDQLQLLFKVQTDAWKKSTKAMQTPNGCLVQVSTERMGPDGSWAVAEALEFVPGVIIAEADGGRSLRAVL